MAQETISKEKIWSDLTDWANKVTDLLGMPIDSEIKEVVIGLNALGINTYSSCGGHYSDPEDLRFPWVGCQAANAPQYRFVNEEKITTAIIDKYDIEPPRKNFIFMPGNEAAQKEYYELLSKDKETEEYTIWDQGNELVGKKVDEIIEEFNSQGEHTNGVRIGKGEIYPGCLINIPDQDEKNWTENLSREDLKQKIIEAQTEMNYFAQFLKKKFFNA